MENLEQEMVKNHRVAQFIIERAQIWNKDTLMLSYNKDSNEGTISYEIEGEQRPLFNDDGDSGDNVRLAMAWFKNYASLDFNDDSVNQSGIFSVKGILSRSYCQKVSVDTIVDGNVEQMKINILNTEENNGSSFYQF
jgi:hypothetical protein